MIPIKLVLKVLALVCESIAALGIPVGRYNLVALGLALYIAAEFF